MLQYISAFLHINSSDDTLSIQYLPNTSKILNYPNFIYILVILLGRTALYSHYKHYIQYVHIYTHTHTHIHTLETECERMGPLLSFSSTTSHT